MISDVEKNNLFSVRFKKSKTRTSYIKRDVFPGIKLKELAEFMYSETGGSFYVHGIEDPLNDKLFFENDAELLSAALKETRFCFLVFLKRKKQAEMSNIIFAQKP